MKISDYNKEQVEVAAKEAGTIKEFLTNLGLNPNGGQYRQAKAIAKHYGVELPKFDYRTATRQAASKVKIPDDEFFAKDTNRKGPSLRKRLVEDHGWADVCMIPGCPSPLPVWNGLPLCLQVDHIDGDHTNNLVENLRFACPNCHTQTDTYSNKTRIVGIA